MLWVLDLLISHVGVRDLVLPVKTENFLQWLSMVGFDNSKLLKPTMLISLFFGCSPTGSHVAFYTPNCSMASEPAAVRSASQITWSQCWRSAQNLLISSRYGIWQTKAWKDVCEEGLAAFDINTTRRQKHVALVGTRSQVLQHPVLVFISVTESARQNSVSGVIFVLTSRLFPS